MTRRCNECTLCCRVLPVAEINKVAGKPCSQQRSTGCRVYGTKAFPYACRTWSCVWLLDESVLLPRPDRAHYVLDPTPDFAVVNEQTVPVIQIWVDPRFPDAHRDPALRAWLAKRWDTHAELALVRFDPLYSIVLFPPNATDLDDWLEQGGKATAQHTPAQIVAALRSIQS